MNPIGTRTVIYEVLDDRFRPCSSGDQQLETLYKGCRRAEGPLYVPAGRYLLWSDIPNDRLLRWDETTGRVGVFRSPAGIPTATRWTDTVA
jgi:gluconolactonase